MSIINIVNPWARRTLLVAIIPLIFVLGVVWAGISSFPDMIEAIRNCWKGQGDLNEKRKRKKQAKASGEEK